MTENLGSIGVKVSERDGQLGEECTNSKQSFLIRQFQATTVYVRVVDSLS